MAPAVLKAHGTNQVHFVQDTFRRENTSKGARASLVVHTARLRELLLVPQRGAAPMLLCGRGLAGVECFKISAARFLDMLWLAMAFSVLT